MIHLTPPPPPLSVDKLLAKYKTARRRKRVEPTYTSMLKMASEVAQPQLLMKRFSTGEVPSLKPFASGETAGYFLGLCTLGAEFDRRTENMFQEDMAAAAIIEEVALAMIVALTNEMRQHAADVAAVESLKVGPAYRPGIGRWPIELQVSIFEKLPSQDIGVSLSEVLVMSPSKSTSIIIPVMPETRQA